MADFMRALRSGPLLADGAMGSYLFERTGRLSETNHVYEALNVDNPALIRGIHLEYLQAGARCLTTNTFGANRSHLSHVGQGERAAGTQCPRQELGGGHWPARRCCCGAGYGGQGG